MDVRVCMLAIFLTTVAAQSYLNDSEHKTLELVQVLFRHGERTPLEEGYAVLHYTDRNVYEPYGFGGLTDNGKNQAYKIGRMLRQRYDGFLSETYNHKDIFAQSAEENRDQISLQLVLAGLYSTGGKSEWNPDSNWNPIPFRCAPEKLDVLYMQHKSLKYLLMMSDALKTPATKKQGDTFSDLREFLEGKPEVQFNGASLTGAYDLLRLWDVLYINAKMNISMPTWYSDDLMSRLNLFRDFIGDVLVSTPELRRAIAGPLVKTILERMNFNGTDRNPRKMYLYSGTDYNVDAVTRALKISGFRVVDCGNTLVMEKLRDSSGQLHVRFLEWDAINEKLSVRKMKECAEMCPAEDFARICRDLLPSYEEMHYLTDDSRGRDVLDFFVKDPLIREK